MFEIFDDLLIAIGMGGFKLTVEVEQVSSKTTSNIKADKIALREFVENFYWGDGLSDSQAKKNLQQGIVELTDCGSRTCNALLITDNGYFITSYHCVSEMKTQHYIIAGDGKRYPVQKVCAYNQKNDIALVKADMPGPARARTYRFANKHNIAHRFPIVMLGRRDRKLSTKGGFVHNPKLVKVKPDNENHKIHNQIWIEIDSESGDSGSVYCTVDDRIYGIHSSGLIDKKKRGCCTFWFQAINLINKVINSKK